jgi:hypothetical protein
MNNNHRSTFLRIILILIISIISNDLSAQGPTNGTQPPSNFWRNVQFGGGIGLGFGSGYTNVFVAPSAIYTVNPIVAVGLGIQFGYESQKNYYSSFLYGGSVIGLVNPIPQIQLSAELEETNSITDYHNFGGNSSDNYWNTALYLGAGYRTGNVTVGVRYDVLNNDNYNYVSSGFMPFVRVYF